MIRYTFSDVAVIRAKKTAEVAQVYGRTIADVIHRAGQGPASYALLFDEAHDAEHPMHEEFDWDQKVAARRWNLERARQLVKAIAVMDTDGNKQRAFVSVTVERDQGGSDRFYAGRARILSSDTLRRGAQRAMFAAVVGFLEAWRSLLAETDEGQALVRAADSFIAKARAHITAG